MLRHFTDRQKEIYEEVKDELLFDDCIFPRLDKKEHNFLAMQYSLLRKMELSDFAPQPILENVTKIAEKALEPYRAWRKENIIGPGHGIQEEDLTEKQRKTIEKANRMTDKIMDGLDNLDKNTRTILDFLGCYYRFAHLPYEYSKEFVDLLILTIGVVMECLENGDDLDELIEGYEN